MERFDVWNGRKDFAQFHIEQAMGFRTHLEQAKGPTGKPLGKSTMRAILATTALTTLFAAPALAQDAPICGGISLVGEWVGGEEASSDVMAPEVFFDIAGQVPIAGHMVRMFTLSEPGSVRVDVSAVPAGDPYIAVYDASGSEVGSDDDSGGNFGSSVTMDLAPGTYCLAARSYESGITDVSVQIGRPEFFPASNDIAPTPGPSGNGAGCGSADVAIIADGQVTPDMLANGTVVSGTIRQAPAYAFDLTQDVPLTITATSELGDPLIRLKDSVGNVLAENDDADGLNSRIDMTAALSAGEYCLEVEDLNGEDNAIVVSLDEFDPVADRLFRLGNMEFAPTTNDDVSVVDLGALETLISQDVQASDSATWFSLAVPAGGLLVIEAVGTDVDPELKLFDRAGREVAYNDDGPTGLDSQIVYRSQPGNYMIGLRLLDSGQSGNVRLLLERYVPAQ
jgi:hypothetical protein